jgi:hypothetical protein
MKKVTLYKPNGDTFRSYDGISGVDASDGILCFQRERTPGDRNTLERIMTTLPFPLEDDMER